MSGESEKALDGITEVIHVMSAEIQRLYRESNTMEEISEVKNLDNAVSYLQMTVGNIRTRDLTNLAEKLQAHRADLNKEMARMKQIVKVLNNVNEVIDIATKIAQIAAGLM